MQCPHCGHEVSGIFCSNCGRPLAANNPPPEFKQFHSRSRGENPDNKIIPIIFLAGTALFGIILLIYLIISALPIIFLYSWN